ncbi:MAG: lipoate--protein ligase family protein [Parachlamydiaceae bacterium]|nr:lipoate--protein ligase family protein [Parachlamydiaceae bacterium]
MKVSPLSAKKTSLHILKLNCSILEQLQLEEALLRADDRNWCLINYGTKPAIIMGISGKKELLVNSAKILHAPVPLIRRFSGGGTVFVDENTFFITWICNSHCSAVECSPDQVHQWIKFFFQAALPALNIQLRENDYVINDRKFGGNAQYLRKQRWLHHSSLLWDYDSKNMEYLLMPPKMPHYRQQRPHDNFLCRLKDFLVSKAEFEGAIFNSLHHFFEVKTTHFDEVKGLLKSDHRKATQIIY